MRERVRWILRSDEPVSADVRHVVEARDAALAAELRTSARR
jgi:hypothetical protein